MDNIKPTDPWPVPTPSRVLGLDFSGSQLAGLKIWLCEARSQDNTLHVLTCRSAAQLPQGGRSRAAGLHALLLRLDTLAQQEPYVLGADFPFSLPQNMLKEMLGDGVDVTQPGVYPRFLRVFKAATPTADAFRAWCRQHFPKEAKRVCDTRYKTPFAAQNLRLYRQTWWGITGVIAPLVLQGVRVVPQQAPQQNTSMALEVCPASTLKLCHAPLFQGYKGRGSREKANRQRLLEWMQAEVNTRIPPEVVDAASKDSEGDALDSVLCAISAWRALTPLNNWLPPVPNLNEGWIYAQW